MTILVTGGAGFIGSNFLHEWHATSNESVVILDKLTYAGNLQSLDALLALPQFTMIKGDIGDRPLVSALLEKHQPRAIIHFAAESHVDRSIHEPINFMTTNIMGTFHLLEMARQWCNNLTDTPLKESFRFLHVSTDEVYGSLAPSDPAFTEDHAYQPNSPYSASKAASDHIVRSYFHTYHFPVITTNCSNNYGPYQFPEKLIPLMIYNAINGKNLPIYGDGMNIRDWLYVTDHCAAIRTVLERGQCGETYNIGGNNEKANIEIVHTICDLLDQRVPKKDGTSYRNQITFVTDRPGHDRRYAINSAKMMTELSWKPAEDFTSGIVKTIEWYLTHTDWVNNVTSGAYREWTAKHYAS